MTPAVRRPASVKVIVAGGSGAGTSTFIRAASDTDARPGSDEGDRSARALVTDFGRVSAGGAITLHLVGMPDLERFGFLWDDLTRGALGGIVVVDTAQLGCSFGAIDYFEDRRLPFIVAVNAFDGRITHEAPQVHEALALGPMVPVFTVDVRDGRLARQALAGLINRVLAVRTAAAA